MIANRTQTEGGCHAFPCQEFEAGALDGALSTPVIPSPQPGTEPPTATGRIHMRRIFAVAFMVCYFALLSVTPAPAQDQTEAREQEPEDIVQKRWEWFYKQRAFPLERIPGGARTRALGELDVMRASEREAQARRLAISGGQPAVESATSWTLIGPQPVNVPLFFVGGGPPFASGRVTALAVDPADATNKTVYLGAAEGGVWKTTDGGATWLPLTDKQASLAVGSIALDPSNHLNVYVGTGEENFNGDAYYGEGILKSTDGGATWTQIKVPFAGPISADSYFGGGARIGSLAVHPTNGQILLAGVLGGGGDGIYRSGDSGATWTNVLPTGIGTSVLFNPANGSIAYAALKGGGVYVSSDAGVTWAFDNGTGANVLPTANIGTIELAIDPSTPATLYAAVVDAGGRILKGLFKTTDGGANWTATNAPDYCAPQCAYDNVVRVAPGVVGVVYVGGAAGQVPGRVNMDTLFRSLDGGSTWTEVSQIPNGSVNLHVDQHALAFSSDGKILYVGNDGGVYSTTNVTASPVSWNDLNQSLAITQFYPGIAIDPATALKTFGGTQDNGTEVYTGRTAWDETASPCGDGGWNAIDPINSNNIYVACIQGEAVAKSADGGVSWTPIETGLNTAERSNFLPPLVIDPSNPQSLYFGTFRVYQTTNGGAAWTPISPDLTTQINGHINTIAVAPSNSSTVYAGTSDSHLQVTTNAALGTLATWAPMNTGLPPREITQIAVDPVSSTTAYVTFSGFSGFGDPLGHVFKTTNGGALWTDNSGNLPNIPLNDIVIDPNLPSTLYVASDIGVFSTSNGGTSWSPLMTGLPNVAILSLKLHAPSRTLRAASHGRSVWDLFVPISSNVSISPATLTFSIQNTGTTSPPQPVTVTNNGATPLTFTGIAASGDFAVAVTGTTCSITTPLAAAGNCTVQVTFTPTAGGPRAGTLKLTDSDPSSPQIVVLTGTGNGGTTVSLSSSTINFGNQGDGTPSPAMTVTLTNTGGTSLTINSRTFTGTNASDFTETDNCGSSVAAGSACTFSLTFTPAAAGLRTGLMSISDNAQGSPQSVALTGTGIGPAISFSPGTLSFGTQLATTTSAALPVVLTNNGAAPLIISSIIIAGTNASDFAINPISIATTGTICSKSTPVGAGAACTVNVTFKPTGAGARVGVLSVADNAADSPQTVALIGTATDFSGGAAPTFPTTITVSAGVTAIYTLAFSGSPGFAGSVAISCAGAPAAATCTPLPTTLQLNGTTPSDTTVSVTTTFRSAGAPQSELRPPAGGLPPPDLSAAHRSPLWLALGLMLALAGAVWGGWGRKRAAGRRLVSVRVGFVGALVLFVLLVIVSMPSCGGNSTPPPGGNGTPAGTYKLTVTGTFTSGSATVTHQVLLNLNVQ